MTRSILQIYGVLCLFALVTGKLLGSEAEDKAWEYLEAQQDGLSTTWRGGKEKQSIDTVRVLRSAATTTHARAKFLQGKLSLLEITGEDHQAAMLKTLIKGSDGDLRALRNSDGGWGGAKGRESNIVDTVEAIEVLSTKAGAIASPERVLDLILDTRGADGYWYLSSEPSVSRLQLTARVLAVLDVLAKESQDARLTPLRNAVTAKLLTHLQDTGSGYFKAAADSRLSIVDTCECYRALVPHVPASQLYNTYQTISQAQANDGSWQDAGAVASPIYTTALVLSVLPLMVLPSQAGLADLSIYDEGLSAQPKLITPKDHITLSALVFNHGDAVLANVKVSFYNGDPRRAGAVHLGDKAIPQILPRQSVLQTMVLDAAGFTLNPTIFVVLDPAHELAESSRANNIAKLPLKIAGLADPAPVHGIDLYVGAVDAALDGKPINGATTLVQNNSVLFSFSVSNLGDQACPASVVRIKDGQSLMGILPVPALAAGASTRLQIPWQPPAGVHQLTMDLDYMNEIAESNESNNSAQVSFEVLGTDAAIRAYKDNNGQLLPATLMKAYESMRFTVISTQAGSSVSVNIYQLGSDTFIAKAQPLNLPGQYSWFTGKTPAGQYKVVATFRDAAGAQLSQVQDNFSIVATSGLRSLQPYLEKTALEGGALAPVKLTATLANGSNQTQSWNLSWRVLDSSGRQLLQSSQAQAVYLSPEEVSKSLTLNEALQGTLDTPGIYTLELKASAGEGLEMLGSVPFTIISAFELHLANRLEPETVSPLASARVKTKITVAAQGSEVNLNLPYQIKTYGQLPAGQVIDLGDSKIKLTLSDIVNLIGRPVADGTKIVAYIPYGTSSWDGWPAPGLEGVPSPENNLGQKNPQLKIFTIQNGKIEMPYSPIGLVLSKGQYSVTVIEFYQFLEAGAANGKWQGKMIGKHTFYLKGKDN